MKYLEKEEDFEKEISKDLVLVDFFATWCGPCKLLGKELEALEKEDENVSIVKIDVDKFENLARKHGVMSIPTIEIYKKNELITKTLGFHNKKDLKKLLETK